MVLKKCSKCKKNITKKAPGLECSRCDTIVHADTTCSKLSNKQLNTLRNSPGIEWSCEECLKNVSRRSSFFTPVDDDDEDDDSEPVPSLQQLDTRKLVQDISREMKKTFKEEMRNLEASLEFLSDQISTMEQSLRAQDGAIKVLESKNLDLLNKNRNLELRMSVLEQVVNNQEQNSLSCSLEIAGLPDTSPKDIPNILEIIAEKLELSNDDIQSSSRLPGSKDKPGPILVKMKSKTVRSRWIEISKARALTAGTLIPNVPQEIAGNRVYFREALTKTNKTLLYTAKSTLGKSFQFIWCKDGKVCIRKTSNAKILYIQSIKDINHIQNQNKDSGSAN
jgi:hypothetical protein